MKELDTWQPCSDGRAWFARLFPRGFDPTNIADVKKLAYSKVGDARWWFVDLLLVLAGYSGDLEGFCFHQVRAYIPLHRREGRSLLQALIAHVNSGYPLNEVAELTHDILCDMPKHRLINAMLQVGEQSTVIKG